MHAQTVLDVLVEPLDPVNHIFFGRVAGERFVLHDLQPRTQDVRRGARVRAVEATGRNVIP